MAIRLRTWAAIVAVSCLVVALSTAPRTEAPRRAVPSPAAFRAQALNQEIVGTHAALQAARWADSLSALAVRDAVDGLAIGFPAEQDSSAATAAWTRAVRAEVEALERRDDRVVIGFYRQSWRHGAEPGVDFFVQLTEVTFAGTRDGTPYCLRVSDSRLRDPRSDLGPCRYFAKYGLAGPHIHDWLRAGNAGHAEPGVRNRSPRPGVRDPVFGINRTRLPGPYFPLSASRCIAGNAEGCAAAILDWGEWRAAPGSYEAFRLANAPRSWLIDWRTALPNGPYLLSDLEEEFGEDGFARFWTSQDAFPEAFTEAFGLTLGEWELGWMAREWRLERAGPGLPADVLILTLLLLAALAGSAGVAQLRRRVG